MEIEIESKKPERTSTVQAKQLKLYIALVPFFENQLCRAVGALKMPY